MNIRKTGEMHIKFIAEYVWLAGATLFTGYYFTVSLRLFIIIFCNDLLLNEFENGINW